MTIALQSIKGSTPRVRESQSPENSTSWPLVDDIELIRQRPARELIRRLWILIAYVLEVDMAPSDVSNITHTHSGPIRPPQNPDDENRRSNPER